MGELMAALTGLNAGDNVTITVDRDGDEYELDAHVTDAYRERPERDPAGYVPGDLSIHMDLENGAVKTLQGVGWLNTATHSVSIHVKERRPGEWDTPSITMWDPVTEDGHVVQEGHTSLGELRSVNVVDGDE